MLPLENATDGASARLGGTVLAGLAAVKQSPSLPSHVTEYPGDGAMTKVARDENEQTVNAIIPSATLVTTRRRTSRTRLAIPNPSSISVDGSGTITDKAPKSSISSMAAL